MGAYTTGPAMPLNDSELACTLEPHVDDLSRVQILVIASRQGTQDCSVPVVGWQILQLVALLELSLSLTHKIF